MGEQNAGDPEVAEESERLDALPVYAVVASLAHIAVLGQQRVKGSDHMVVER